MSGDFTVTGADQFVRLSKALKDAGEGDLRKELHKGMRDAVKPVMPKAAERLRGALPSGMRSKRATPSQVVKVKTGTDPGISVGVRWGARSKTGLGAANARLLNSKGAFRHPVYADGQKERKEWRWVEQPARSAEGWFDKTYTEAAPEIRKELEKAMESVAETIVRKAGHGV